MRGLIGVPRGAADRIWRGSGALTARCAAGLAGWVRKGRRDDLHGVAAALGPVVRLAVLVVGGLAVYGALRVAPVLLWPATVVWCWRAWRGTKPADQDLEETPLPEPSGEADAAHQRAVTEAVTDWVRDMVGDRNGVHLVELLTNAQEHHLFEGLELTDFRAHLEARGIPVRQQLKVGGRNRPGVHRQDLPPAAVQEPVKDPSPAAA